jgi:VWFA-related protein
MLAVMRRLAAMVLLFAASAAHAQFRERIEVVRIVFDLRVTDLGGNPISDLKPEDFTISIGGKRAEIESLEWIDDTNGAPGFQPDETVRPTTPQGRLFVFFVQTDFARNASRTLGHMSFLRYAEKMIDGFAPEDRVAVLQFDSHLRFRLDFTSDKETVQQALRDTLRINDPPLPPIVPEPSLASRLDREAMRRAANSERGLLVLGRALRTIPGPKTILLLGWGLGQLSNGRVRMTSKYEVMRQSLDAARASVFAIDLPEADYHDLEIGLQQVAEDTGGLYVKTFRFPEIAVERLQRTLEGHYEIELRRPDDLKPGTHPLRIRVRRRGAIVLAPSTYMDRH